MKNILITGASSGLGEEFARQYAQPDTRLFLTGRDAERLALVAQNCSKNGVEIITKVIDVTNRTEMEDWIKEISALNPLDIVIANAGISGGFSGQSLDSIGSDYAVINTNVMGVLNTIHPALPAMINRGSGHLVLISSLASFMPMPSAPAYSASKVAVRYYGEALRSKLRPHNIKVTVICPGFIKSRMTDVNTFPMPFLMETDKAVAHMIDGISKGCERIDFPWQMVVPLKILSRLPQQFINFLLRKLPNKP